jgi:hypothetical protein
VRRWQWVGGTKVSKTVDGCGVQSIDLRSEEDRTVRIEFVDFARKAVSHAEAVLAPDPRLIAVNAVLAEDATEGGDRE